MPRTEQEIVCKLTDEELAGKLAADVAKWLIARGYDTDKVLAGVSDDKLREAGLVLDGDLAKFRNAFPAASSSPAAAAMADVSAYRFHESSTVDLMPQLFLELVKREEVDTITAEIDRLMTCSFASPGDLRYIVIEGLSGSGKTTLASTSMRATRDRMGTRVLQSSHRLSGEDIASDRDVSNESTGFGLLADVFSRCHLDVLNIALRHRHGDNKLLLKALLGLWRSTGQQVQQRRAWIVHLDEFQMTPNLTSAILRAAFDWNSGTSSRDSAGAPAPEMGIVIIPVLSGTTTWQVRSADLVTSTGYRPFITLLQFLSEDVEQRLADAVRAIVDDPNRWLDRIMSRFGGWPMAYTYLAQHLRSVTGETFTMETAKKMFALVKESVGTRYSGDDWRRQIGTSTTGVKRLMLFAITEEKVNDDFNLNGTPHGATLRQVSTSGLVTLSEPPSASKAAVDVAVRMAPLMFDALNQSSLYQLADPALLDPFSLDWETHEHLGTLSLLFRLQALRSIGAKTTTLDVLRPDCLATAATKSLEVSLPNFTSIPTLQTWQMCLADAKKNTWIRSNIRALKTGQAGEKDLDLMQGGIVLGAKDQPTWDALTVFPPLPEPGLLLGSQLKKAAVVVPKTGLEPENKLEYAEVITWRDSFRQAAINSGLGRMKIVYEVVTDRPVAQKLLDQPPDDLIVVHRGNWRAVLGPIFRRSTSIFETARRAAKRARDESGDADSRAGKLQK